MMRNENNNLCATHEGLGEVNCIKKPILEEKLEMLKRAAISVSIKHSLICEILSPMPIEAGCCDEESKCREAQYLSSILDQVIHELKDLADKQDGTLEDLREKFGNNLHL